MTADNDLTQRLTWVQAQLPQWGVDAVLISDAANRRWLSGFTGSNGMLLVTAVHAILATDFRYLAQAAAEAPTFTIFKHERTQAATRDLLAQVDAARIGLEAAHVTLAQAANLRAASSDVTWHELPQTVEPARMRKTAVELAAIQRAAAITDAAMAQVPKLAVPGISEQALAWELEKAMRDAGADGPAFPIIVAAGPNSALPHHHPGERPLQPSDALIVDMGAMVDGYRSDLTRTFFLGDTPTEQFWRIYRLVDAARTAVFQHAAADMTCKAIDAIARDAITSAGYGEQFGHGLGHGVGLQIHEDPFLSPRAAEPCTVPAQTVLTIEPGIYIPDWGGVRIEDLAVMKDGNLRAISRCPQQPAIPLP